MTKFSVISFYLTKFYVTKSFARESSVKYRVIQQILLTMVLFKFLQERLSAYSNTVLLFICSSRQQATWPESVQPPTVGT